MSDNRTSSQQAFAPLFTGLNDEQKAILNEWAFRVKGYGNIVLFMTGRSGEDKAQQEKDRQEMCVMLSKAIDKKDFSAFKAGASASAPANPPATTPETKDKSPKKEAPKAEPEKHDSAPPVDDTPKKKSAPAEKPPATPARSGSVNGKPHPMDEYVSGIVERYISEALPKIVEAAVEKLAGKSDAGLSESQVKAIAKDVADEAIKSRLKAAFA